MIIEDVNIRESYTYFGGFYGTYISVAQDLFSPYFGVVFAVKHVKNWLREKILNG